MQVPAEYNGFVYIADGSGEISGTAGKRTQVYHHTLLSVVLFSPHAALSLLSCCHAQWYHPFLCNVQARMLCTMVDNAYIVI